MPLFLPLVSSEARVYRQKGDFTITATPGGVFGFLPDQLLQWFIVGNHREAARLAEVVESR